MAPGNNPNPPDKPGELTILQFSTLEELNKAVERAKTARLHYKANYQLALYEDKD